MTKKGFTLIEIMIALGVAMFLIGMSIYGFQILQKDRRDKDRVNTLTEMSTKINDYRKAYLRYPPETSVVFKGEEFNINAEYKISLKTYLKAGDSTSASETKYVYGVMTGGFLLCVQLENGTYESGGTIPCTSENI